MKKLFTLMVMALVAMSVNAKEVLTLPDDMGAGKTTQFGSWAWRDVAKLYSGAEIAEDASDAGVVYYDASAYDYLVIKYKECTVATNFGIQYNSKGTVGQWGPELYQSQEVISANTSGVLGVKLDADHKNKAYKVYLQTQGEGSLQIEEVYLGTTAEYEADVKANPVVAWYPETAEFLSKFSGTKNDDGTMTFKPAKEWDWLGAWFGDYDASYYSYVVVELAEPVDFTVQLAIQHVSGEDISLQVKAGEKAAILELSENKNHIKQAALQNAKVGDFTVKAVYFATNEYIQKNRDNILYGDTQDIALSGLNPWKNGETARATFDAATGVLTITDPTDGGAGWWQGSADYSHFDNFVVEFESTTAGGAVVVQYVAEEAAASRRANAQNKVEFGKGATNVVIPLNAAYKNAVQQMWIQGNSGASYTIKKAYVAVESATPEANLGTIEGGDEPAAGVTYQFNNQASTYVLGDYAEATTYTMDSKVGFSVNYTGAGDDQKMQIKLAANPEIFFEYSNKANKPNAVKTGENYMQCDSKNFVINIPVKAGDVIYVKYSAKGSNAAKLDVYGSEPAITAAADAVKECTGKTEGESVIFKATATKGGTAKIKETNGGMRIYAISINQVPTGIQNIKAATKTIENNEIYNLAGQRVNENYKGIVIKNGKKYIQK